MRQIDLKHTAYDENEISFADLQDKLKKSEHKRNDQAVRIHNLQREVMVLNHQVVNERNKVENLMKKTANGVQQEKMKEMQDQIAHQNRVISKYLKKDENQN